MGFRVFRRRGLLCRHAPAHGALHPAEGGDFACQAADEADQDRDHFVEPLARFDLPCIEIAGPVDLELEGMEAALGGGMAFQHIAAGIGPVVRRAPAPFGEIGEGRADQTALAGRQALDFVTDTKTVYLTHGTHGES